MKSYLTCVQDKKIPNGCTVDSAYLQVVFVTENIAIKRSARLPESSIQTGSLTELQMETILSFY